MKQKTCALCGGTMEERDHAVQVFRRGGATVTVTGIPAVRVCLRCQEAVLEWDVARQVEDLVMSLLRWSESHHLRRPSMTVVFPVTQEAA